MSTAASFSTDRVNPTSDESNKKNNKNLHVIVLDDDTPTRHIFGHALEEKGILVTLTATIDELVEKIQHTFYDAVLTDYFLDNEDATSAINSVARYSPFTKVYVMTASQDMNVAIEAMEKGARTCILKSLGPSRLADKLIHDIQQQTIRQISTQDFGILGESKAIKNLRVQIETIKDTKAHVLVTGETGTGKELVARALHFASARKLSRFEAINCGAIPEQLLESELFGHTKGAFTDAKTDKKGLFETCQNGTIFLDEIGEMPMSLQVKILRVLQDREVRPIGSTRTICINTRIVAATNRNLAEEVQNGKFREDLYYRLSVLNIRVPPLRDRGDDIEILFRYFLDLYATESQKVISTPSREILSKIRAWHWPGNVRELQNAVERAVIFAQDQHIACDDLFSGCSEIPRQEDHDGIANDFAITSLPMKFGFAKKKFETVYIDQLLTKAEGNIAAAARLAGKTRIEIYRLIERNHINLGGYRV